MDAPAKVELTGVPETALWNLYQRVSAVRAGHLDDPRAVEVLERLDYPFERFNQPYGGLAARLHALRVRTMDAAVRRVLAAAPDATVAALGEWLKRTDGPHFARLLTRLGTAPDLPRPKVTPPEVRERFMAHIGTVRA